MRIKKLISCSNRSKIVKSHSEIFTSALITPLHLRAGFNTEKSPIRNGERTLILSISIMSRIDFRKQIILLAMKSEQQFHEISLQ